MDYKKIKQEIIDNIKIKGEDILKKVSLPGKWKGEMIEILGKERMKTERASFSFSQKLKSFTFLLLNNSSSKCNMIKF